LRVSIDQNVASKAFPFAKALADDAAGLAARFAEFRRTEAAMHPTQSSEILALKLKEINFFSSKRPDRGEVYFSNEPSGESWGCVIEDGTFRDLGLDT
jgi:hypothetical protein